MICEVCTLKKRTLIASCPDGDHIFVLTDGKIVKSVVRGVCRETIDEIDLVVFSRCLESVKVGDEYPSDALVYCAKLSMIKNDFIKLLLF